MVVVMGSFEFIVERKKGRKEGRKEGKEKKLVHAVFPATFKKRLAAPRLTRQIYVNRGSCKDNKLLTLKQFGILWQAVLPPPAPTHPLPPPPPSPRPLFGGGQGPPPPATETCHTVASHSFFFFFFFWWASRAW